VSASSFREDASAQDARVRADIIHARAEWLRRRLIRERRQCAEALSARGYLDFGDLEELEDVAPALRLVDDAEDSEAGTT
jgi:hypothetical protein